MVGMEHFTASMKMKQNTVMNKYKIRKLEEKIMAANIETMFYVRETPWHGLGTRVLTAPASKEALEVAGLNWKVVQEPVYTEAND